MIVVIVDTVRTEPDLSNARLVVFVNTKKRATKLFSKLKRSAKKFVEIKVDGNVEMNYNDTVSFYAWIGAYFAEHKERVVVFEGDRTVVFAKGVGEL